MPTFFLRGVLMFRTVTFLSILVLSTLFKCYLGNYTDLCLIMILFYAFDLFGNPLALFDVNEILQQLNIYNSQYLTVN
jgi:hypothetical protein